MWEVFDMTRGLLTTKEAIWRFLIAGSAILTIVSKRTQERYTFKVTAVAGPDIPRRSVYVLSGPDNTRDYLFAGRLTWSETGGKFEIANYQSEPAKAFKWFIHALDYEFKLDQLEVWHEGRCGRCARLLTVPESIATGFGPECQKRRAAACLQETLV